MSYTVDHEQGTLLISEPDGYSYSTQPCSVNTLTQPTDYSKMKVEDIVIEVLTAYPGGLSTEELAVNVGYLRGKEDMNAGQLRLGQLALDGKIEATNEEREIKVKKFVRVIRLKS